MNTLDEQRDQLWEYLEYNGLVSEEALKLVIDINGYSLDTLEDVLYATTGYRSLEQIEEAEEA